MGREASLWKWLRGGVLPRGHYSRIESETSAGFPDVNYCIQGTEGNLELKVSRNSKGKYPFKRGGLRTTQINWMLDRVEHQGLIVLLAQVGKKLYGFRIKDKRSLGLSLNYMTLDQVEKAADIILLKRRLALTKAKLFRLLTGVD